MALIPSWGRPSSCVIQLNLNSGSFWAFRYRVKNNNMPIINRIWDGKSIVQS